MHSVLLPASLSRKQFFDVFSSMFIVFALQLHDSPTSLNACKANHIMVSLVICPQTHLCCRMSGYGVTATMHIATPQGQVGDCCDVIYMQKHGKVSLLLSDTCGEHCVSVLQDCNKISVAVAHHFSTGVESFLMRKSDFMNIPS